MKLLDQFRYVIRKGIIFYSTRNATQKIWQLLGISYLHKVERLSNNRMSYSPSAFEKRKAIEGETFNRLY